MIDCRGRAGVPLRPRLMQPVSPYASAATRKPQFDDELAGVFDPLAATR
jgi:hypothetical protein